MNFLSRFIKKNKSAKPSFEIGCLVEFDIAVGTCDMFGCEGVVPKGTIGLITDKNVTNTVYNSRYYNNIEVTYNNGKRILLTNFKKQIKVLQTYDEVSKNFNFYTKGIFRPNSYEI